MPNPLAEVWPYAKSFHSFKKKIVIDSVKSFLLVKKNKSCFDILLVGQLEKVSNLVNGMVDLSTIHCSFGLVVILISVAIRDIGLYLNRSSTEPLFLKISVVADVFNETGKALL